MTNLGERIIVLIDMDCFFCQVESRLEPKLQGKPLAVVQYNQWRSGGIIAVNYEARNFGVTRHMRGDEAKEKCSDIVLVSVPSLRGKADTSKYRLAGREVIEILKKHCTIIERASVDEAYLDITDSVEKKMASDHRKEQDFTTDLASTYVVGYCENENNDETQRRNGLNKWLSEAYDELGDEQARKLAIAGVIVEKLRAEIYAVSRFRCSAGISYNKILAKLACGLHKPNRQTILPGSAVASLYSTLPVKKVRNLGGKFGNIVMESLGCNVMADLMRYSMHDLQKRFDEKTGCWLYNIARGIDNEPVVTRLVCKSIGASKNFPGKQAIVKLDVLKHWVNELASDVSDRLEQDLEENERRATTLTVSFSYYEDRKVVSQSRSCSLKSYKTEKIASQCVEILTKSTQKPIINVSIATGKFVPAKGSGSFVNFFKNTAPICKTENSPSLKAEKADNVDLRIDDDLFEPKETKQLSTAAAPAVVVFTEPANNYLDGTKMDEPASPNTAILGNERSKKALNRENLKNSFFMNFLKDAKPSNVENKISDVNLSSASSSSSSSSSYREETKSAETCPIKKITDPTTPRYFKENQDSDARLKNERLVSQLREIFPDFENMDRSVVQLLPMEMQKLANSYLKTKSDPKVSTPKTTAKLAKTKIAKPKSKLNSLDNFFVATAPSYHDNLDFRKCSECGQLIREERFSEHEDFHVAKNLQREINRVDSSMKKSVISPNSSTAFKRSRNDEPSPESNGKKAKCA